jgi:hypothetical protein
MRYSYLISNINPTSSAFQQILASQNRHLMPGHGYLKNILLSILTAMGVKICIM